jgi:hypothetical protein
MSLLDQVKSALRDWRPPPWLVALTPGSSRTFFPPRRHACASALTRAQAEVRPLALGTRVVHAAPTLLGGAAPEWLGPPVPEPMPPAFLLTARDARLLLPGGTLVLRDDTWVTDCGFFPHRDFREAARYHPTMKRKKAQPARRFAGRTLSLASDYAIHSYGHWLIDSITRWQLIAAAGVNPAAFDHIYLPCPGDAARRIAEALPLPRAKLRSDPPGTNDVAFEELTVTSHPSWPGHVPSFAAPLLRGLSVTRPPTRRDRRLWLARDGFTRNFANTEELYPLLRERGFEIIDPRTTTENIPQLCREAECVAAIEGSQAYDMLFCEPGTRVLILCAPGQKTFPYPSSAAGSAGLELFLMMCTTATPGGAFVLPRDVFAAALDNVIAGRTR